MRNSRYFNPKRGSTLSGQFNPQALAEEILMHYREVVTIRDTEEMYFLPRGNNQKWKKCEETYLKEKIAGYLGKYYRKEFVEETISYIKTQTYEERIPPTPITEIKRVKNDKTGNDSVIDVDRRTFKDPVGEDKEIDIERYL